MARTDSLTNYLTDLGAALREKTGTSDLIPANTFDTVITNIQTKEDLTTELTTQTNLLITQDETIDDIKIALQGKTAGGGEEIVLQEKTVTPSTSQQNVTADTGYNGLSKVVVSAVTSSIDSDIKASNIKKGVNILGVTGTMEEYVEPTLQSKSATPKTTAQTITPDSSYDGLSRVSISAVTSSIDSNIKGTNIKKGISILGVAGSLEEGITPTGTLPITENGTYDVTNYESAKVNVASSGGDEQLLALINRSITDLSNEEITKVGTYAFYNCTSLTSINIPNATTIDSAAFRGCTKLSTINIPKVTSIGTNAFMNCSSIKSMSLSVVPTINTSLFYGCTSLESVNFPDATSVKNDAFRSCTKLKTVDLAKVTSINAQAFKDCSALEKLILRSTTMCTLANVSAFAGSSIESETGYIFVPDELLSDYRSATNWSSYAEQIVPLSAYSDDEIEK